MVIEQNGIKLEVTPERSRVLFRVLEQSRAATDTLKLLGQVTDEQTGLSLRSNNKPFYKPKSKIVFVRGSKKEHHDDAVEIPLSYGQNADSIVEGIRRLVNKVTPADAVDPQHKNEEVGPLHGGTTHCRFAFINKAMATKLSLTAKDHYPEEVKWDPKTKPIVTVNKHYNEHIGQIVDVLNKAHSKSVIAEGVVNPHKVTAKQARTALDAFRKLFQDAYDNNHLVATWRLVSGARGPDFTD